VPADERALERLFLDNTAFEELAAALDYFCPFDAVGMDRQEIRHGFFLRYILDPHRPHGFEAECLRGFMWAAAAALRDAGDTGINPLDVHLMDLDSAIVEREFSSIDLLIQVPAEKVVVAVELKIDANEHSGQLGRYRKIVAKEFANEEGWRQIFLFVTKRGEDPSKEDGAGWFALPLENVVEMLERVVARETGNPVARMMLNAYVGMLRRRHLTDPRLDDLARGLWREHREVLEFLMSRRPNVTSEVMGLLLANQTSAAASLSERAGFKLVPDHSTRTYARFAVKDWDAVPGMLSGTGWPPSERMLLVELVHEMNGSIRCKVELGPGPAEQRQAIFEAFKSAGADVGGNWALAAKWRQLAAKIVAKPTDEDEAADIYARVISAAGQFLASHLPRYDRALKTLTGD
jgi:hypothetical protein